MMGWETPNDGKRCSGKKKEHGASHPNNLQAVMELYLSNHILMGFESRVAQRKRAGPITQRSVDRNYALLNLLLRL